MPAYVASLTASLDDQVSAGAAAAAAALGKMADAADQATASTDGVTVSTAKAGPSFATLANRSDAATQAANNLAKAQAALASAAATCADAVAKNADNQSAANSVMDAATARLRSAQAAYDQITGSSSAATSQLADMSAGQAALADSAARATSYQSALNAQLGITNSTPDSYEQRAADVAAYGAELDRLRSKFDPVFALSKQYEATLDEISIAEKNGALSANTAASAREIATAGFKTNIDAANKAATAVSGATEAHAGFYREIVILGHEMLTGNYSRIPGSLVVLVERSGQLEPIFKGIISAVTSLPGILTIAGVAGVAAFTAIAVITDNAANRLNNLQQQLRGVQADYIGASANVMAAASQASQDVPGVTKADGVAIGGQFEAVPGFAGTESQIHALIALSADLGKHLGEDAAKGATELAAAMTAPGDAAEKLVGHLNTMSQSLADAIKLQADAGDKAGAFARYVDAITLSVGGANSQITPLRQAIHDLKNVFDDANDSGQRTGEGIGTAFAKAAAGIVNAVTATLGALKQLHDYLGRNYEPWAPEYGQIVPGPGTASLPFAQVGQASNVDPALLQRLQSAEGVYRDGQWITSPTGAVGAMQVTPTTWAGMQNHGMIPTGADINDPSQNVAGGGALFGSLLQKYGSVYTAVLAYHDGEPAVDKMLADQQKGDVLTAASDVSTAALREANKVTEGYVGSGVYAGPANPGAPTVVNNGGVGLVNTDQAVIDQGLSKTADSLTAKRDNLEATITSLEKAQTAIRATGMAGADSVDSFNRMSDSLDAARLQLEGMVSPLAKLKLQIDIQTDAQVNLAAAFEQGHGAAAEATARNQAYGEALTTVGLKSANFETTVASLTQKYLALNQATSETAVAQQTLQNSDQLTYIQAETSAIGLSNEARTALLDHLKAEQDLESKNVPLQSAVAQKYLASADAVSQATSALAKQQQTLSDVESLSTQVFDQVGSSITQAFASGGKSALDFGSIFKSVMASVAQEVLKLSVLNPVLNSLFGGSRTTLSDVGGLLGVGGVSSGSGGGGFSTFGAPGSGIGGPGWDSAVTGSTPSAGGFGGGFGGLGNLFGGLSDSIDNLGSSLFGLTGSTSTFGAAGSGIAGPSWDAAITGSSGASLSGILGGAGAGFGIGTLFNSLVGGNQLGGTIGSGVGSLAGAAIGSVIPGVGTLIGGLLGGLAGGGIGGLFGNSKPSDKGEYAQSVFTNGQAGAVTAAGVSSGAEYSSANSQAAQALATNIIGASQAIIANFGGQFGGALGGGGVNTKVGERDGIGAQVEGQAWVYAADSAAGAKTVSGAIVGEIVDGLHDNLAPQVTTILKSIDYTNLTTATQQINQLGTLLVKGQLDAQQQIAAVKINFSDPKSALTELDFVKNTYEPATNAVTGGGSIAASIKTLQDNYTAIISHATTLGLATDTLLTGEADAIQKVNDAAAAALADTTTNLQVSGLKAQAIIANNGTPAGAKAASALNEQADLQAFDQQATDAATALTAQLTAAYGNGYKTTATYAAQITLLDQTQAQQRLAIQAQYNAAALAQTNTAASAAASVVSSLTSYVIGLQTSSASPLNPKAQYQLAAQQYQSDLAKAQAGDATSIGNLQGYASAFLSASQNVNGSGVGYAADFSNVLQALSGVATLAQDALTQDFMTAQFTDLRDTLSADLAGLQAAVNGVKAELMLQGARP